MEKQSLRAVLFSIGCVLLILVVVVSSIVTDTQKSSAFLAVSEEPLYGQYDNAASSISAESHPLVSPSPARRRQKRLPQCLIIGVRKGGTRALLDALALQPYIRIARQEMHFFNDNETYAKGSEWYRQQMPYTYPEQVTVEKTPAYFTNHYAAQRVHRMNSSMKLILILRDPVTRTISDFTQDVETRCALPVQKRYEYRSLFLMSARQEEIEPLVFTSVRDVKDYCTGPQVVHTKHLRNKTEPLFESEAFLNDSYTINVNYKPVRNSLYSLHMSRWLKYFPLHRFLILDGDKFIIDPLTQLRKVESFLRIPESFEADQFVFNKHKGFFCFRQKDRRIAKCLGNTKGRAHVDISPESILKLRENFRAYNEKFFRMVNQWWNWWDKPLL